MARTISESDWKLFRQLHAIALDRFCQRILAEINRTLADVNKSSHDRYLAICKLIERRDEELADAFDDLRRSSAFRQLACIQKHELLTDKEMSRFSPDTRAAVQIFLEA